MKKTGLALGLVIIAFIFININVYAVINCNGAGNGYDGGDKTIGTSGTIESFIIEGTGYYLAASSSIQGLLHAVELRDTRGTDTMELYTLAATAAASMGKAVETYEKLTDTAAITPYNPDVQAALKAFPYDACCLERRLNKEIFDRVKNLLIKGDITGVLKQTYSSFRDILEMTTRIKEALARGEMPGDADLRRLNEACAEASLFGSYAAGIFSELR